MKNKLIMVSTPGYSMPISEWVEKYRIKQYQVKRPKPISTTIIFPSKEDARRSGERLISIKNKKLGVIWKKK